MNFFFPLKYFHLIIATAFTLVPLVIYDEITFQKYFFMSMPYHFTSALFFNNSAKIWYKVDSKKIKKLKVHFGSQFIPYALSIPFLAYFLYLSFNILSSFELAASIALMTFSMMHAHLGIFMIFLLLYSKKLSISLLVCQVFIISIIFCAFLIKPSPIWFLLIGILYSMICTFYVKNMLVNRPGSPPVGRPEVKFLEMIRPDNIFSYVFNTAIGYADPIILKIIKSSISCSKLAFYAWPNHLDNEIRLFNFINLAKIFLICVIFSIIGIILLTQTFDVELILIFGITTPIFLMLNRFVDIFSESSKNLTRGLNALYFTTSIVIVLLGSVDIHDFLFR